MLFDKNKRHLATGDAWPTGVRLAKGKYTVRLQLRHESVPLLESLKELPMVLDCDLAKPVSLSVFPTKNAVILNSGGSTNSKFKLEAGARKVVFLGAAKQVCRLIPLSLPLR
jgi:tripeptidyl-peptidase-2